MNFETFNNQNFNLNYIENLEYYRLYIENFGGFAVAFSSSHAMCRENLKYRSIEISIYKCNTSLHDFNNWKRIKNISMILIFR